MDTTNFFIYPNDDQHENTSGLVFLENATDDDWQMLLDFTSTRRFKQGEMVIQQGESDDSLAFVAKGELEVLIPKGRANKLERLTIITAGSIIGEQSFLDKRPRSTSIRAISDGELYRLNRDAFTVLSAKHPHLAMQVALDLGRILSLRLRNTTQFLAAKNR